ncbi:MAG TPA: hypothetical protein VHC86_04140 [Opitutaceae bacterium]|nr:hypothetical protein [Opitutaceae bacterium]
MKSTTKSTKSPAPATISSLAPAPAPKLARAPRVKKNGNGAADPAATGPTVITARIDVGFGNALYVRGEGPGLSWTKGLPLTCVSGDTWTVSLPGATRAVIFKFLLNDETWSRGEDYTALPSSAQEYSPSF